MIILLVITDGRRDCIERTIPSALEHLQGPITTRLIYDDSGDVDHWWWLANRFADDGFEMVSPPGDRRGFGGAIRHVWSAITEQGTDPFVFHLEDDFTFDRHVPLLAMASVLEQRPHLAQLALRRQPWNPNEVAAGGIVEQHPDDYLEHEDGLGRRWLEHGRFFTTNPSLYRRSLCEVGWPDGPHSEGHFGLGLLAADPATRFGYWGARTDPPWVTHIGHQRVGTGY